MRKHPPRTPKPLNTPKGLMSRREASIVFGVPLNTIHMRKHKGMSDRDCLRKPRPAYRTVIIAGKPVLGTELFPDKDKRNRFYRFIDFYGMTGDQALRAVREHRTMLGKLYPTAWGMLSLKQIAWKIGANKPNTVARRIATGWTTLDAFNTPSGGRPRFDFVMDPKEFARLTAECEAKEKEAVSA